MKRFIAVCLAGVMFMSTPAFADGIVYNGETVTYASQEPVIINSRTYVPIRDVFEKLGFEVEWDGANKLVDISNDYHHITLSVNGNNIYVMNADLTMTAKKLENPVQIINSKTMLPLREILEAVDYELDWNSETKTTTIKDVNDYAYLKAQVEKLESMDKITMSDDTEYKVDKTKPVGKLTDAEKAYLTKLYTIAEGDDTIDLDDIGEGDDIAQAEKAVAKVIAELNSVECPDSLKEVHNNLIDAIGSMVDIGKSMNGLSKVLETETDDVQSKLGMNFGFSAFGAMLVKIYQFNNSLNDFYKSGNYDPEAELGDIYDAEFSMD